MVRSDQMQSDSANKSKNQPLVKVLIIGEEQSLSGNMREQYAFLKKRNDCQVEFITEEADEEKTASKIKQGNYDLVLIDEGITSSAWKIIDFVSNPPGSEQSYQKPKKFPRFYLDGSVDKVL